MIRIVGFGLITVAVALWILTISNATNYIPTSAFDLNLREAAAVTVWRAVENEAFGGLRPPGTSAPTREVRFQLSLGNAAAILVAVGFLGVGLLVFGKREGT
jgi:hypothetical protein